MSEQVHLGASSPTVAPTLVDQETAKSTHHSSTAGNVADATAVASWSISGGSHIVARHKAAGDLATAGSRTGTAARWLGTVASWSSKGLAVSGGAATAVDQYQSSPATTTSGKAADGLAAAGVAALFDAAMGPAALMDAATGGHVSRFLKAGSRATVSLVEAAITGDTRGIEEVQRRSMAGENGTEMQVVAESGAYWADHGVRGTLKDFAREVGSLL